MISLNRIKIILTLALPIMGGAVSQSLLNLVDTLMVSNLGDVALAGVGIGGYATFVSIAVVIGIGAAVQTLVARKIGQGNKETAAEPLNTGIALTLIIALPLYFLFSGFSGEFMALLNNDSAVVSTATDYYGARIVGIFAVGLNFCFRGFWTGVSQPMIYMRTLIIMHICNVIISYGLIFGAFGLPALGAKGAGMGTSISLYIGSCLYALQCLLMGREYGFLRCAPKLATLRRLSKLSIPSSAQQLFFATGLTILFWIIGQIGTPELAVAHVLINLVLFLILPAIGLGMAATTLVSESIGKNNIAAAHQWGWDVSKMAMLLLFVMGMPVWLFPDLILSLFFNNTSLIELGTLPLRITGLAILFDGLAIVMTNSLIGAGAVNTVMKVNIGVQWLFFLPLAYFIGPVLGMGLTAVWLLQVTQRLATSSILGSLWAKKRWATINI